MPFSWLFTSNLMWTFIALNLHQLTDSKVQLNNTSVNNCKSNNLAGSYQEVIESLDFCKLVSFWAFSQRRQAMWHYVHHWKGHSKSWEHQKQNQGQSVVYINRVYKQCGRDLGELFM